MHPRYRSVRCLVCVPSLCRPAAQQCFIHSSSLPKRAIRLLFCYVYVVRFMLLVYYTYCTNALWCSNYLPCSSSLVLYSLNCFLPSHLSSLHSQLMLVYTRAAFLRSFTSFQNLAFASWFDTRCECLPACDPEPSCPTYTSWIVLYVS